MSRRTGRSASAVLAGAVLGLALALGGGGVREARAEDAATQEATQRFEEGNTLWGQGKHEQARLKYVQAWAVLKKPGVLFNLARAEQQGGRTVDAYVHFREFLKMPQTDAERTALAKKFLADLGAQVSLISVSPGTPSGAKVIVDGVVAGETPLADPIVVLPGSHDILVSFGEKKKRHAVACPVQRTVVVDLSSDTRGPDGPPKPPPPDRDAGGSWTLPVVLGVVGVGGLAAGAVLGSLSTSSDDELRLISVGAPCTQPGAAGCKPLEDAASKASGLGTGSMIGYVGGGVFLGAALVSAIVLRPWATPAPRGREAQAREVRVVPSLGGAAVVGRF